MEDELRQLAPRIAAEELELQRLLVPKDPHDDATFSSRSAPAPAATRRRSSPATCFACTRAMPSRKGWQVEVLEREPRRARRLQGNHQPHHRPRRLSLLKFESGTHRVQRVPATEAQGRIHTSACTVAILPELEEVEAVDLNPADLRIDTFRASGAGGQHVNKTDSAIRITHLPTGIVVECQDERSQHKNRSRAMSLLKARLLATRARKAAERNRRSRASSQVGSGDRSERIRTYNFPQGRVTDHRINLTLYKLDDVMNGDLDELDRRRSIRSTRPKNSRSRSSERACTRVAETPEGRRARGSRGHSDSPRLDAELLLGKVLGAAAAPRSSSRGELLRRGGARRYRAADRPAPRRRAGRVPDRHARVLVAADHGDPRGAGAAAGNGAAGRAGAARIAGRSRRSRFSIWAPAAARSRSPSPASAPWRA